MDLTAAFAIFCVFIAAPTIVFTFIHLNKRNRLEVDKLRYRKEILELEIAKEDAHTRALVEENRKYDHLIQDGHREEPGR